MFVDVSKSTDGDIVLIKFNGENPNNRDWEIFEKCFRGVYDTMSTFSLLIDMGEASMYPPKWIQKMVKLLDELRQKSLSQLNITCIIIRNSTIRKLIEMMLTVCKNENTVIFKKSLHEAMAILTNNNDS